MAVITTSYAWAVGGGQGFQTFTTAAPTQAQAAYFNQLEVLASAGDADTTCTITHNWSLSAAQQSQLFPNISYIPNNDSLGTVAPVLKFAISTNTVALTKLNTVAGSGGTYLVLLNRPLSTNL